jgi:predicted nucleic acid-binding Zn ribbon protein
MLIDVKCTKCEEVSEIVAQSNDVEHVCPLCGAEAIRLWTGGPRFRLIGGGFYSGNKVGGSQYLQ